MAYTVFSLWSHLLQHSVNWISSSKPLDTPVPATGSETDSKRVSAGTKVHAETSWTSIQSIFTFLKDKEDELMARQGQTLDKSAASLAQVEEFDDDDDDDDEKTLEMKYDEDAESESDDAKKEDRVSAKASLKARAAGIEISSSEDDSQASFDFMRYSEELWVGVCKARGRGALPYTCILGMCRARDPHFQP